MRTRIIVLLAVLALLGAPMLFAGGGAEAEEDELEIFSWWTAGGEADGLEAMFEVYEERNPGVDIINAAVAGGAGTDAQAVLATRLQGGDPPDSFQVHAGQTLLDTYVAPGLMEPVTFLYDEHGWREVMPEGLIDLISVEGEIYSVPAGIHRSNVLWYNQAIFDEHGLSAPVTLEDAFEAAETLADAGVTPIALGDTNTWPATHVLESLLLATLGPDGYSGLWTGDTRWDHDGVYEALTILDEMLEYVNSDHAALTWDEAAGYVADGTAAMTIMGDWAQGFFTAEGLEPEVDYGWAPSPGTEGSFLLVSDTFGLPEGAPHRENAIAWLEVVGSREGQDAFNPLKGSIPPRTDADRTLYDSYLQSAMDAFETDEIAPSVAHGAAANEAWADDVNSIMSFFVSERDVDAAVQNLVSTAAEHL